MLWFSTICAHSFKAFHWSGHGRISNYGLHAGVDSWTTPFEGEKKRTPREDDGQCPSAFPSSLCKNVQKAASTATRECTPIQLTGSAPTGQAVLDQKLWCFAICNTTTAQEQHATVLSTLIDRELTISCLPLPGGSYSIRQPFYFNTFMCPSTAVVYILSSKSSSANTIPLQTCSSRRPRMTKPAHKQLHKVPLEGHTGRPKRSPAGPLLVGACTPSAAKWQGQKVQCSPV